MEEEPCPECGQYIKSSGVAWELTGFRFYCKDCRKGFEPRREREENAL